LAPRLVRPEGFFAARDIVAPLYLEAM
jgi:hypothetical protein